MALNKAEIERKLELLKKKRPEKSQNLPFFLRIQQTGEEERLERVERMQEETFFNLIKKREELKHLKEEQKDLFIEYWLDWLNGKVESINDFFYENCKDTSMKSFFEKNPHFFKKNLREKYKS